MKRVYEKPDIVFESFSLSTNIAGDCETQTTLSTQGVCGYQLQGFAGLGALGVVFVDMTMGCGITAPYDNAQQDYIYNNSVCYHVPITTNNLFNS